MGIFSSIDQMGGEFSSPINLALGMFDGVHMGHQEVLKASAGRARDCNGKSVAFTFPAHPASYLRPDLAPPLLMNPEQKARMLHSYGVDHVIMRDFDEELSQIQAADFPTFLLERIPSLVGLSVGKNFRFGRGRDGDSAYLKEIGDKLGMLVTVVDSRTMEGTTVSSSRIRKALGSGEIKKVNEMLGRDYRIYGEVLPGKKMGRTIGFPTMNLLWNPESFPAYGVYAGKVKNVTIGSILPAVANYGIRPTVENDISIPKLEIHVLKDLDICNWKYGSDLEMSLNEFIRPEMKFKSVDDLRIQIKRDREIAQKLDLRF
jgi:riboflavin kinase/FMN adenylyltransferase